MHVYMLDRLHTIQDFEALTPNLLARTIETVEGGGIVVLLLSTLTSLTQLFSLTMDVHSRLRTESHQDVTGEQNLACMHTSSAVPAAKFKLLLSGNRHCCVKCHLTASTNKLTWHHHMSC